MQDGEQEPEVARHRRLEREQRLDRALDAEKEPVDLVVEGDHLVGELLVALLERAHRAVDRRDRPLGLFLELRLDLAQVVVDRHCDTVLPSHAALRGWFTASLPPCHSPVSHPFGSWSYRGREPQGGEIAMRRLGPSTRILALVALAGAVTAVAVGAAGASTSRHSGTTITGAGSTFVSPLVAQWISPLGSAYGYELQYSAVGSGAGITSITSRTVDFGASDAPLTPDQFSACNGCIQIPWALGATSVMYNLPGVPNLLKMDGPTLANIFMGKITTWNDPAIAKLNKGVNAPEHEDLDRAPLGQLGHDLQLHRLPLQRQPGLELADRQGRGGQLAGRLRRQGQRRCGRARHPDARLDRLRRRLLRHPQPPELLRG